VKTAVCVRKPGPIAEVAIKNAAAMIGELYKDSFLNILFITADLNIMS